MARKSYDYIGDALLDGKEFEGDTLDLGRVLRSKC